MALADVDAAAPAAVLTPGRARALAAVSGLALTLAQPPFGLWPLLLAWSALLLALRAAPTAGRAAQLGWIAGAAYFLSGLFWIGEAFLVEGGKVWWYLPLMPVAVAALAAVLALFWAAGFALAHRLGRRGGVSAAGLALAMLAAEWARGSVLTGFPWGLQAYAWADAPPMQAAALVGAHALSGLTILLAALPGAALAGVGRGGVRRWAPSMAGACALVAVWAWGAARPPALGEMADRPVIRLVQPNVGQRDKWAAGNTRPIFDGLLELSARPAARAPALVVWPEVAVTFLMAESPEAQALAAAALPPGAALAAGAVRRDGDDLFNSLLFFAPGGGPLGAYDKVHLTPFGEYVPYGWLLGALGFGTLGDGLSGFTPGQRPGPVTLPGLPPAAPLICYEIVFPAEVASAVAGAEWILQVTNDSWFGDSAGPRQHLAQARVRAIEQGLPVARAANTGVSAMIDPYGRVLASLALDARGALDSPLPPPAPRTLFARTGPQAPILLCGFALAGMLVLVARRARAAQGQDV